MARIILSTCFARRIAWADDYAAGDADFMPLLDHYGLRGRHLSGKWRVSLNFSAWHGTCLLPYANKKARRRQRSGADRNIKVKMLLKANENRWLNFIWH